jgi:hypothetical protein
VSYPLTGEALFLTKLDSNANYSGKIIFYRIPNFNFVEDTIETLQGTNPLALVSISYHSPGGITKYERARHKLPPITIPVFEISPVQNDTFEDLPAAAFPLTIRIEEDDPNPWDHLYLVQFPALAACILFTSGIVAIIAAFKLTNLILKYGVQINLAQIVLAMNLVGMLLRCAWSVVDPFGSYGIYVYAWVQMGLTLPCPFSVGGALIIALYWHEMLTQFGHPIHGFLGRMLIPFLVSAGFSFTWELVTSIVRGLGGPTLILYLIDGLIYAAIILSLFVLFLVTSFRLEKTFARLNAKLNQRQERLRVINRLVVALAVAMISLLVFLVIVGSGQFAWQMPVRMAAATGVLGSLTLMSLFQVLIIRAPEPYWFTYLKARLTCSKYPFNEESHSGTSMTNKFSASGGSPMASPRD